MSDQTDTVTAPWWTVPDDPTAAAVLDAQMRIIDAAVRSARRHDWCGSFEHVMNQAFPDGPPDGSREYVDSSGRSCRDRDRDGYDRDGYDAEGRDRDGYDTSGRDAEGFNREGIDRHGWSRDGWNADRTINRDSEEYRARFRYDTSGFDSDGFNRHGQHRESGLSGEAHAAWLRERQRRLYRFDEDGYDVTGVNRYGDTRERVERGY